MKQAVAIVQTVAFFLVLSGALSGNCVFGQDSAFSRNHEVAPGPSLLSVSGHGQVRVRPDKATVRLAIVAQAEGAGSAQQAANTTMQKVIQQVRNTGVPDRGLQTTGLDLSPVYAAPKPAQPAERSIIGYRASNVIQVETEEVEHVGKIIDAGLSAGANRVDGVSFGLRDELPHRAQALKLAAEEAQAKARALAGALDVTITSVHRVHDSGVNVYARSMSMAAAEGGFAPTPVQAGELQITATVMVEYRIDSGRRDDGQTVHR